MASGPGDFAVTLDFRVCPGVHQIKIKQEGGKKGGVGGTGVQEEGGQTASTASKGWDAACPDGMASSFSGWRLQYYNKQKQFGAGQI